MDTDDLSKEAYDGIIGEAETFSHDLTLHYGVLSSYCNDEEEYLSQVEELTKKIMSCDNAELDDLFFGNPPKRKELRYTLEKILSNIKLIRQIPLEKRQRDFL